MVNKHFCLGLLVSMGVITLVSIAFTMLSDSNNTNNPPLLLTTKLLAVSDEKTDYKSISTNNTYMSMFILGDSSVDCSENTLFYHIRHHNLSLYPCANASRSSLIPQLVAKKMNLPVIPTFYEQNGTIQGILNGLNYGSAKATILTQENGPSLQSLSQQLRQVFQTFQLLELQLGEVEAHKFLNSSVFYLSLGKDDYINFLFGNTSFSMDYNRITQTIPRILVNEMTNAIKNLYDRGVRKVIIMGIYPLGCAPRAVVNAYILSGKKSRIISSCVNQINQLISQHNQLLNDQIIDLNRALNGAQFIFCDVFEGFRNILSSPQKFGFDNTTAACCGRGWHKTLEGCHSMEHACQQTSSHVWWDLYNPTEAVNSILADAAWSGQVLGEICHPGNIQGLVKI